ncbi:MAG: PIG-L deacetylase family protein [Candidatus Binatia bacterium]
MGSLETGPAVIELSLRRDPNAPLRILCLGAHSDDIEIGCGGTILRLTGLYPAASVHWIVLSADGEARRDEALAGAGRFLERAAEQRVDVKQFRESFFPYAGERIKEYFESIKSGPDPDVIFTHYRNDLHQDHKLVSDLTWNTFRRSLILEYEIPKWDGDLGAPSCYVRLAEDIVERKIQCICETFASQRTKPWFTADTFRALMRLRGIEANTLFAEAFYARKLAVG